jgi:hypothetical protein
LTAITSAELDPTTPWPGQAQRVQRTNSGRPTAICAAALASGGADRSDFWQHAQGVAFTAAVAPMRRFATSISEEPRVMLFAGQPQHRIQRRCRVV